MKRTILAVALAAASIALHAEGLYGVAMLGQSKLGMDKETLDSQVAAVFGPTSGSSLDSTGTAWRLAAGYRAHPNIAFEAGWANLGQATYSAQAAGATIRETVSADGPTAAVLLMASPASWLTGYLKAGLAYQTVTAKVTASSGGGSVSASASSTSLTPTYGAGVIFNLTKNIGIRAEFERFHKIGGAETGRGNVDTMTMGLQVGF